MKKLTIEQQELLQQIIQGNNLKPITPPKALNEIKRQIGNIHIYSLDETPPRETTIELRNSGLFDIIEKALKALEIIKEKKVFVANLIYHFENDDNVINYNRSCGWAKSELSLQEYDLLKEVLR